MDTSAVLKLYRTEPNTPLVRACLAPSDELFLSELVTIEVVSASYGLVRQRILTKAEADTLIATFEADKPNYIIVSFEVAILREARASFAKIRRHHQPAPNGRLSSGNCPRGT